MTQIAGWILERNPPAESDVVLRDMIAKSVPPGRDSTCALSLAGNNLVGVATNDASRLVSAGDLVVAWAGRPVWRDEDLSQRSDKSGFGETVAETWRSTGIELFRLLRGPFALIIVNIETHAVGLAIDRLGVERLTYQQLSDGLLFGTCLDAYRGYPGSNLRVDPQSIYNYLYFHMVPAPQAIYQSARKLMPAECLEVQAGKVRAHRYWSIEYASSTAPEAELVAELKRHLQQAVSRSLWQTPTAAFLSGGLDSTTVVGMAAQAAPKQITAFGIGFDAQGYDEMPFARASAAFYAVPLNEYYVTPEDVRTAVELIAESYDEPFGNASAVPAYFCALAARNAGYDQILAGDGGDEIFAGNERYAKQKLFEHYQRLPQTVRQLLIDPLVKQIPQGAPSFLRKLQSYVVQASVPLPERLETYNFLHRQSAHEIFEPSFLGTVDLRQPVELMQRAFQSAPGADTLKRMLRLDLQITLADNDIRKVSRMCEAAGIEVAYPMLDEDLVDMAARVPSRMLLKGTELRSFYRHALSDFLPSETLAKRKHGFGLPFGLWMAEDAGLQQLADQSLNSLKQRGVLRPSYLSQLRAAHRSEHASYYGVMIWTLVALEAWLQARDVRLG